MKKTFGLRSIVIVISSLVLAAVCTILVSERISGYKAAKVQQEVIGLKELGKQNYTSIQRDEIKPLSQTELAPEIQSDFLPLLEENNQLIGWLTAGDMIDFPVMQVNNEYYLSHNFFKQSDPNGVPFLDGRNTLYPRDDVLVIHGHNMKSGAMFGKLKRFTDFSYLCKYPLVSFRTIYDENDVFYTPVAAFHSSMTKGNSKYFDVTKVLFEDEADAQTYLSDLAERSIWQPKTDVFADDELLILATCSYYFDDGRLILVCRALRDGETPETITALYDQKS